MANAPNAAVEPLLAELLTGIHTALGHRLAGVYLYGSLVTGDFDPSLSDIDLLAVTAEEMDDDVFSRLDAFHRDFAAAHPRWDDRVEVAYVSAAALQGFRERPSTIAVISPGEPFHRKEAGKDWLINWWSILRHGVVLFGPPPSVYIPPISDADFTEAVRKQAQDWREWVHHRRLRKEQSYVILTMCRALAAVETSRQLSKIAAANWAIERLPDHAQLIRDALAWRIDHRNEDVDYRPSFPSTVAFVEYVADLLR